MRSGRFENPHRKPDLATQLPRQSTGKGHSLNTTGIRGTKKYQLLFFASLFLFAYFKGGYLHAANNDVRLSECEKLSRGQVVVNLKDVQGVKFVVGKIIIDEPPDQVWPVLTNPFEFERRISPRMRHVEVVLDERDRSVLKCTVDVCALFPKVTYIVESLYTPVELIEYRRVGGLLRDFKGSWIISPVKDGTKTEVIYSMFLDPGFPVPQWIIREGVKVELPRTLNSLRARVKSIYTDNAAPAERSIMASANVVRT